MRTSHVGGWSQMARTVNPLRLSGHFSGMKQNKNVLAPVASIGGAFGVVPPALVAYLSLMTR